MPAILTSRWRNQPMCPARCSYPWTGSSSTHFQDAMTGAWRWRSFHRRQELNLTLLRVVSVCSEPRQAKVFFLTNITFTGFIYHGRIIRSSCICFRYLCE